MAPTTAPMTMPEINGRTISSLSCIRIRYDWPTRWKLRPMRPMRRLLYCECMHVILLKMAITSPPPAPSTVTPIPQDSREPVPLQDLYAARLIDRRVDRHGSSQILDPNRSKAPQRPREHPSDLRPDRQEQRLDRTVTVLRRDEHRRSEQARALEPKRL